MEQTAQSLSQVYFGRVGRLNLKPGESKSNDEFRWSGIKLFKRGALGFWGRETIKSLDQMVNFMTDLGMVSDQEEALKVIPRLKGKKFYYSFDRGIEFEEVEDGSGLRSYKISLLTYRDPILFPEP